jgi:4-hydroxy-3-polyprenylbenzoate decarboxylase
MPWSQIDLRNALRCSQAGAIICPAAPGFYLAPRSVADLVDFVVGRVLDLMDVAHSLNTRWMGPAASTSDVPGSDSEVRP